MPVNLSSMEEKIEYGRVVYGFYFLSCPIVSGAFSDSPLSLNCSGRRSIGRMEQQRKEGPLVCPENGSNGEHDFLTSPSVFWLKWMIQKAMGDSLDGSENCHPSPPLAVAEKVEDALPFSSIGK